MTVVTQNSSSGAVAGSPVVGPDPAKARIYEVITSLIAPLGYDVVHFEVQTHREKVLRIFIDRSEAATGMKTEAIGVEDCATVSRTLDEPLDLLPELDALFHGASYELEVSSPGVERPLRGERDFSRFAGRDVRVHTYRALTAEEAGNPDYHAKNPKQKNFVGKLLGMENGRVRLSLTVDGAESGKKGRKPAKASLAPQTGAKEITIPFALISKANIEPDFEALESKLAKSEKDL